MGTTLANRAVHLYQAGQLTVLGFGGQATLDHLDLALLRDELLQLIEKHECKSLAFDLTGVAIVPSGMLGLLASFPKIDVDVHLFNASEDMRDVLEVTKLDQLLGMHEVEIPGR